jgi:hypothetical protein
MLMRTPSWKLEAAKRGTKRMRKPSMSAKEQSNLSDRQPSDAMIDAFGAFEARAIRIAPQACRDNALRFSEVRFH